MAQFEIQTDPLRHSVVGVGLPVETRKEARTFLIRSASWGIASEVQDVLLGGVIFKLPDLFVGGALKDPSRIFRPQWEPS